MAETSAHATPSGLEDGALEVLRQLSEGTTDGYLIVAIATVRTALLDRMDGA